MEAKRKHNSLPLQQDFFPKRHKKVPFWEKMLSFRFQVSNVKFQVSSFKFQVSSSNHYDSFVIYECAGAEPC